MTIVRNLLKKVGFRASKKEEGQTAVEYVLVLALVALVLVILLSNGGLGNVVNSGVTKIQNEVD